MPASRRTRLAVAALLELARHAQPLPLAQLSRRLRVSMPCLELVSVLDVASAVDMVDAEQSHRRRGLPPGSAAAAGRIDSGWCRPAEQAMAARRAAVSPHDLVEADRSTQPLALAA